MSALQSLGDSELMSRVQQGDDAAFGALVIRHELNMKKIAYAILRDWDQSEDVVQDVFWKAYCKRSSFDPDNAFGGWLRTMVRNKAIDKHREQGRGREVSLSPILADPKPGPAELFETRETNSMVQLEVSRLPSGDREIITQRDLEERDYASIARDARCPLNTVRVREFRARQMLRDKLKDKMN